MKFEIKNKDIASSIDLLHELELEGLSSVHRTRFIKVLDEQLKLVQDEFDTILKGYCGVDKDYQFKENDRIDDMVKDKKSFEKDRDVLFEEVFVINDENMNNVINTVKDAIINCTLPLSGSRADAYYVLYEALEGIE